MAEIETVHGISQKPGYFILEMGSDLKLMLSFALVAIAFIYAPVLKETILRSALGVTMVLFAPGYTFVAVLFPGIADIDGIERVALSFGLSIAMVPLVAMALNYTPWGIRLNPLVICLTAIIIVCSLAANKRRCELPKEDRFSVDFKKILKEMKSYAFADTSGTDKVLTIVIILLILLSMAIVAYVIIMPDRGETFTGFYILGPDGKADNYPTNLYLGEPKPVIVGVLNHEHRDVAYDLVIVLNDSTYESSLYSEHLTVADNQTWEKCINITPDRKGTNMHMEFLLYADGNMTVPYRECQLWVNVTSLSTFDVI